MEVVEGGVFSGVSVEFGGFGWAGIGWAGLGWDGMGWARSPAGGRPERKQIREKQM